jgi:NTP pyrophosphatase (non-canonical NTP hydrolase)
MTTLKQLQEEQRPWVKHNFGDRPTHQPLLGIVEEIGELSEALERLVREGGKEVTFTEIKDALADITIFLVDYASAVGWDMEFIEKESEPRALHPKYSGNTTRSDVVHWLISAAGQMCHHHLKCEQGIRGDTEEHRKMGRYQAVMVIAGVRSMCVLFDFNFQIVYSRVWAEVKKRDWKKDSVNADKNV